MDFSPALITEQLPAKSRPKLWQYGANGYQAGYPLKLFALTTNLYPKHLGFSKMSKVSNFLYEPGKMVPWGRIELPRPCEH